MKNAHIISIAFVSILFLSSFGFVEYSVIQPKFNISVRDSTKSNENKSELVVAKNVSQNQSNDQKVDKDETSEQKLGSWNEYFAKAIKSIFLKSVSLFLAFFIH
jgi:hypothetical protein